MVRQYADMGREGKKEWGGVGGSHGRHVGGVVEEWRRRIKNVFVN